VSTPPAAKPNLEPKNSVVNDESSSEDSAPSDDAADAKNSAAAGKTASSKPAEAAPLMVKGGKVPSVKKSAAAPDAPAPSMLGIATPGAGAPLDLGTGTDGPKPLLQRLNISQGVSTGLLIKKVQPSYPSTALTMRIEGTVELLATISKSGDITAVKVLSGDSQLAKAASTAVKQWKYKPYLLNGEPVEIQTPITINFKLPH
jgi:protein TonB